MGKRVRYSKEFKLEAVRLLDSGKKPAVELALELGIRRNQLYKWKKEMAGKAVTAFPGPGRRPASQESEVSRLKRELAKVWRALASLPDDPQPGFYFVAD